MSVRTVRLLGCLLGLASSGCGVFFGDPIELFPEHLDLDGAVIDHSAACLENVQRIGGDTPAITGAASAREYAALVDGHHTDDIIWPGDIPSSIITLEFSNTRVYSVMSRINPAYAKLHTADQCADHVRIDADLAFKTADGKLNESVKSVSFTAYNAEEASAQFSVLKSEVQGSYAPTSLGKNCYVETSFRLLAALGGVSGAMIDEFRLRCDDGDAGVITLQAGGHWGARWEH